MLVFQTLNFYVEKWGRCDFFSLQHRLIIVAMRDDDDDDEIRVSLSVQVIFVFVLPCAIGGGGGGGGRLRRRVTTYFRPSLRSSSRAIKGGFFPWEGGASCLSHN